MNPDKLAKLQASVRIGGKGTPRRKVKKTHKATGGDDKKIQMTLKKFNSQPIPGIEEVNFFKDDGNVIHITQPQVQAALTSNTFSITGNVVEKELSELVPNILHQLGPDSINSLRRIAEMYPKKAASGAQEDDDIPDLETNFEEASIKA